MISHTRGMTLDNVANRAPCGKLHARVCSAGGLTLGRGRSLLHADRSCDQVARPLLGGGAGGRYLGSIYGKAFYMPLFVYRCPTTGYRVQGFSAEDVSMNTHTYEPVVCPMCKRTHHVNPATGTVLGEEQTGSHSKSPARST
jgi:hypothetical protein